MNNFEDFKAIYGVIVYLIFVILLKQQKELLALFKLVPHISLKWNLSVFPSDSIDNILGTAELLTVLHFY